VKHAERVRAPDSAAALRMFLDDHLDVAAGVKQPLVKFAQAHSYDIKSVQQDIESSENVIGAWIGRICPP
jgi:hypothetical protein